MRQLPMLPVATMCGLSLASVYANAVIGDVSGVRQTLGAAALSQEFQAGFGNPAAPAAYQDLAKTRRTLVDLNVGGRLEYGDVDGLFDLYDELSGQLDNLDLGSIDVDNPDIDNLVTHVKSEADNLNELLTIIADQGYAVADVDVDLPILIGPQVFGGTLTLGYKNSVSGAIRGLIQPINFDAQVAKSQLQDAYALSSTDPVTSFTLSDDLLLTVDPSTGNVDAEFLNDSMLISKTVKLQEFKVGYSHLLWQGAAGQLYMGARFNFDRLGLSRFKTFIGDITDAQTIFDNIRDGDYEYDNQLAVDLGLTWSAQNYQLGMTVKNANSPEFTYSRFDTQGVSDPLIKASLDSLNTIKLDSQVRLETALYSTNRHLIANLEVDADSVHDLLGRERQLMTVSLSYGDPENLWPDLRIGYNKNLVGSELSQVNLGFTFFRYVDLDLSAGTESVDIDGDQLPRELGASLGFHIAL